MNIHNRKLIFALLGVFLMTSGIFTLVAYIPAGTVGSPQSSPALSNVGETASTSTSVSYWTNGAVANSGTTTVTLNSVENTSQTNSHYSDVIPSTTEILTTSELAVIANLGDYYYFSGSPLDLQMEYLPPTDASGLYDVNTFYVYIYIVSLGGTDLAYSGDSTTYTVDQASSSAFYIGFATSWAPPTIASQEVDIEVDIIISPVNSAGTGLATVYAITGFTTPAFPALNEGSGSFILTGAFPIETGWNYGSQSVSSTYTIPQYESSYQLSWTTPYSGEITYNGASSTTSPVTGSLTVNSLSFNANGADPPVPSYTFSYYLTDQYQVSSASATQTASPTYTYVQSSGTTNQASASFGFTGTTPSGAVFIPYEAQASSETTTATNIVFTPSVTIQNPYSSYTQNQLVASLTGSSTGSSTTSNSASPSFTGNSATFTTASSPSWTVNLNLYGNRHPVYQNSAISLTTVNPLTPITLYANYSETNFTGETQYLQSSWNGRALESAASTTDALSQQSHFSTTGSKLVSFYASNSPNPSTNGLSALDSGSNSYSVNVVPFSLTPSPVDYSSVGTSVLMSLAFNTQTSAEMTIINLTVNGVLENRYQPDVPTGTVKYDFTQPVSAPLLVTWTASDQFGYSQSITFQY
jgi:hypothetical protein